VTINLEDNAVVRPLMEKAERQGRAEGRSEGRAEGRSEGRAEGVNEGRRQQLLSLLAEKFGPVPLPVNELIHSASVEQLDRWARQLIKATSIEDTLK
jgi:predicted transposase YdaD